MRYQKLSKTLTISLLLVLILGLAACGGRSESESDVPAEPTTAIETPAEMPDNSQESAASDADTVEATAEIAETAFELRQPTTLAEAVKAIDLQALPLLDKAETGTQEIGVLRYETPVTVAQAIDFYVAELTKRDWQEETQNKYVSDDYAQTAFTKNDFYLSLSVNKSALGKEGISDVTLMNHGNVDVRALPKYPDAESIGGDTQMNAIYATPAEVASVVDFSRQELAAQGWQEYIRPNTAYAEDPNSQSLTFKQNGVALSLYISVAPAQDGKTTAQYSVTLLNYELPALADATDMEFDDFLVYLGYTTPTDFVTTTDFYRQEMTGLGWEEISDIGLETPDKVTLFFTNQVIPVVLLLTPTEDGQTQVTLRAFEAEELTELTAFDPGMVETDIVEDSDSPVSEEEILTQSGAGAPDIPLPEDAQELNYDASSESVNFVSAATINELVTFYRDALAPDGWVEDETFTTVDETFGMLYFTKGEASLDLTFFESFDEGVDVTVSTYGLVWEMAGSPVEVEAEAGSDMTIDEWPIPAEAMEIKVRSDELEYVIDWDFKQVIDFYSPVYSDLGITLDCFDEEDLASYSSISCSTGNGVLSISLNLFSNFDDQTEVSFYFFGLAAGESSGQVSLIDQDGVLVPSDFDDTSSESSEFRTILSGTSESDLASLVELYRTELAAQGWQEQSEGTSVEATQATLKFESPDNLLTVELSDSAGETEMTLLKKSPQAAKAMGVLPPAGQSRIYLGNIDDDEVTITLAGQTIKVKPSDPSQGSPDDLDSLDVAPGEYTYTLAIPGESEINDTVNLNPDETWLLMIGPGGALPLQLY